MADNKESVKNTGKSKEQEEVLKELQEKTTQARVKRMIKYSFELKKVGLIDSLRQNVASELTSDEEINKEITAIHNLLAHYLEKKEVEEYLKTIFLENEGSYKDYRHNLLNINLLDTLEMKLKAGEVKVNKVRQVIKRYEESEL